MSLFSRNQFTKRQRDYLRRTLLSEVVTPTNLNIGTGTITAGAATINGPIIGGNASVVGLRVLEGANGKQGVATLAAGTVTVANTSVTASSRIMLTGQDNGVTGALRVSARTPGTSFVITSSVAGDAGVAAFEIFEPY